MSGLGKAELCRALGWHRMKLDRRLKADANFPRRPDGLFDRDLVLAYLGQRSPPVDPAQLRDAVAPPAARPAAAMHMGEASARQRKDHVDTLIKVDRLRKSRGELVDVAEMRASHEIVIAGLSEELNGFPRQFCAEHGFGDDVARLLENACDTFRTRFVERLARALHGART